MREGWPAAGASAGTIEEGPASDRVEAAGACAGLARSLARRCGSDGGVLGDARGVGVECRLRCKARFDGRWRMVQRRHSHHRRRSPRAPRISRRRCTAIGPDGRSAHRWLWLISAVHTQNNFSRSTARHACVRLVASRALHWHPMLLLPLRLLACFALLASTMSGTLQLRPCHHLPEVRSRTALAGHARLRLLLNGRVCRSARLVVIQWARSCEGSVQHVDEASARLIVPVRPLPSPVTTIRLRLVAIGFQQTGSSAQCSTLRFTVSPIAGPPGLSAIGLRCTPRH